MEGLYRKFRRDRSYEEWSASQEAKNPSTPLHRQPLISVILAARDRSENLDAAVQSVISQTYPSWELCICADSAEYLESLARKEPRVRYSQAPKSGGLAEAFNAAASLAQGDYLAFLEAGDVLSPLALHEVALSLQDALPDVLYTDEDRRDESHNRHPVLKPDWSPELLRNEPYWGHLLVIARSRWAEMGGFHGGEACFEDAAARLAARQVNVRHVPGILYHAAKPARRRSEKAPIIPRHDVVAAPRCSIVICTKTAKLLRRCLRGLTPTRRDHDLQILVVVHQEGDDRSGELAKIVREHQARDA